jgi:hypothetical protein
VRSDHASAARLWGAATAQRDAALGPEHLAAAATAGAALDLEAALVEALTC